MIAPYELTLARLAADVRAAWGERTVDALQRRYRSLSRMTFQLHAGAAYRRALEAPLNRARRHR